MQLYLFTFRIKWGDGASQTITGWNGTTVTHTYASLGSYVIQVAATDARGATLPADTQRVTVGYAALQGGSLVIKATAGNDTIALSVADPNSVGVTVNGVSQGVFTAPDGILIQSSGGADTLVGPDSADSTRWTLSGNRSGSLGNPGLPAKVQFAGITNLVGGTGSDVFEVTSGASGFGGLDGGSGVNTLDYSSFTTGISVNLSTGTGTRLASVGNIRIVIGGSGNDTLVGGNGPAVLMGSAGNDSLRGGAGRTLLVGGSGADSLTGGSADAILIGGRLAYDDESTDGVDLSALDGVLAEWQRADETIDQRIANLTFGGGRNGPAVLGADTLIDDSAVDSLFEGAAGQDWFLLFSGDQEHGNGADDRLTNL
jgi:Ca2+-binding RTX toxin-like protein